MSFSSCPTKEAEPQTPVGFETGTLSLHLLEIVPLVSMLHTSGALIITLRLMVSVGVKGTYRFLISNDKSVFIRADCYSFCFLQ